MPNPPARHALANLAQANAALRQAARRLTDDGNAEAGQAITYIAENVAAAQANLSQGLQVKLAPGVKPTPPKQPAARRGSPVVNPVEPITSAPPREHTL